MSMRTLEASVLAEARMITERPRLRMKDIAEWSTGKVKAEDGETRFFLPLLRINVAVKTEALGTKARKPESQKA